jgi:polar amino acid transport system ATP-binding protein
MIIVKSLKKVYGSHLILDQLNLSIQQGEILGLLGPSGSGKSTFLRCINYLEEPSGGEIWIDGVLLQSSNIQGIRSRVGMVFQSFNLFPHMNVLQNLIYAPLHVKKVPRDAALEKAKHLLNQVGLKDKAYVYPQTLSGGQKQRVAVARTLMMDPEVILFDEPTSSLDPEMVQEVLKVIHDLGTTGITMLIVTHEMSFIREIATRILFLEGGKIVEDRNCKEFFNSHINDRIAQFLNKK